MKVLPNDAILFAQEMRQQRIAQRRKLIEIACLIGVQSCTLVNYEKLRRLPNHDRCQRWRQALVG